MAEYLVDHSNVGRVRVKLDEPITNEKDLNSAIQAKIKAGQYESVAGDAQPQSILHRMDQTYRQGAEFVTQALSTPVSSGLQGMGVPQDYADPIAQTAMKFVIPQTPLEAGLMLGTMGAGGMAAKAGLKGAAAIGTRIAGGIAGGALGGAVSETPVTGALEGAAVGAVGGAVGEGVGMGLSWVGKRMATLLKGGSQEAVARAQAKVAFKVGQAFEQIPELAAIEQGPAGLARGNSIFGGVNTPEAIRDLVKSGQGHDILSTEYEKAMNLVQKALPASALFPDPMNTANFVPFNKAKESLSKLRERAFTPKQADPSTANVLGKDAKELFNDGKQLIRNELMAQDPTGQSVAAFDAGQEMYRVGVNLLKSLQPAFKQKANDRIVFDASAVQNLFADKQRLLQKSLTQPVYDTMAKALTEGGRIGLVDLPPKASAVAIFGRTPLPGPGYARESLGSIGAPPRLIGGNQPSNVFRTGVDVLTGRVGAPIAEGALNELNQ